MIRTLAFFVILITLSCTNNMDDVNRITQNDYEPTEVADDVKIIYSDSGKVLVQVEAPSMIRKIDHAHNMDIFPKGIKVTFLSENGKAHSWLVADYAERSTKKKQFLTRGKVKFFNDKNESLQSTELVWEEKEKILNTEKFVMLIQPKSGDTSYGYGFRTNEKFTRFEIKNKTASRVNISKLMKSARK